MTHAVGCPDCGVATWPHVATCPNWEPDLKPNTEQPFPFPGARGLLSGGVAEARRLADGQLSPRSNEVTGILVQIVSNAADAATVLLFGNQQQQAQVHAWMDQNRQRSR